MERQITKMSGNLITLLGEEVKVGDKAPDFEVRDIDFNFKSLQDFAGKLIFISAVPSIDTNICETQAKTINEWASLYPTEVAFLNISMDLPFSQKRWSLQAETGNITLLSDSIYGSFGRAYGILIKELRLLNRAIFIIGNDMLIKYVEIVAENTELPNFEKALQALKYFVMAG